VLFPSCYDTNKSNESPQHSPAEDLEVNRDCVKMALRYASGKPVYCYIWPRWHDSNAQWGFKLIHEPEFKEHVKSCFQTSWNGDRADGIVWWGADRYYRNIALQNLSPGHPLYALNQRLIGIFNAEIPPGVSDEEHFNTIHARTLNQLDAVLDSLQGN
jgi:hypothetical protein